MPDSNHIQSSNLAQRLRAHISSEQGSGGISTFFAAMSFFLILGLGVAGMRVFSGAGDLQSAAQSAARAAALEHNGAAAVNAATSVATAEVANAEEACENLQVIPDLSEFEPGGAVSITLTCDVSFADLFVPWATARSRQITVTAVEPIDCLLGGGTSELDDNCYYGG